MITLGKLTSIVCALFMLSACVVTPPVTSEPTPAPEPKPAEVLRAATLMDYYHRVRNMDEVALTAEKEKLDAGLLSDGAGAILLSQRDNEFYSASKSLKFLRDFRKESGANISANEDAFLATLESLLSERIKYSQNLASLRAEKETGRKSLEENQAELQALQEQNQLLKTQLEQLKQIEQNINQRIQSLEPQE